MRTGQTYRALLGPLTCCILLAGTARAPAANAPGGGTSGPNVTLSQHGKEVVLTNGIITATIAPESAEVTSIKYKGEEMVSNSGRHKSIYFSRDGGEGYETPSHCVFSVTTQTPDTVDISCKHVYTPGKDKHAWDADVHFALRRGASGLYLYVVNSHEPDYPEMGVGEWRMVWSTPENPFLEKIYIDDLRHWEIPSPQDFASAQPVPGAPKEVSLLTTGLWKGKYDCKYMYSAEYYAIGCWGFASDRHNLGAWLVLGGYEFFNDGPPKQDLSAAVGTTLVHLNRNHYDGSTFSVRPGESWTKIYGPWLLYFNDKRGGDACWEDAREQSKAEAAAWPYEWVKNAAYPLEKQRGSVKGRLVVRDRLKPELTGAGAWVGLAMPEQGPETNWQYQGKAYQYWARAAEDGSFTIPHVRPGTYTLYAYTTGAVGEVSKPGVTVRAGSATPLGDLTWDVPHKGRQIAWEIGVPDRTAAEFRHGKDYFMPLLYKELPKELPDPLEYTVGKSDSATDWNYAQTHGVQGGKAVPAVWRVQFDLPRAPAGTATLTLALAGAHHAKLAVSVNGDAKPIQTISLPEKGGNGLIREAVHEKYRLEYVPIPTGRLKAGHNTITLTQEETAEDSYIMYDYLNLEE